MYAEVSVRPETCVFTCDVFLIGYSFPYTDSDTPPRSAHKCTATCLPTTVRTLSLARSIIQIYHWHLSPTLSLKSHTYY
jgi:hypothetical protein